VGELSYRQFAHLSISRPQLPRELGCYCILGNLGGSPGGLSLAGMYSLGSLLVIQSTGSLVALVAVLAGASAWLLTGGLRYEELSKLIA
jgi:hypothetical protein